MKKESKYRNNGYQIPENYFDTLEERLSNRIAQQTGENNVLSNYKGNHGYKTPDSYFDTLEERISETIAPKVIPLFSWKKIAYSSVAIAAAFVLIFSIYNYSNNSQTATSMATIDANQLQQYIHEGSLELTLFDI